MTGSKYIADQIAPYQYKVPSKLAFYLTKKAVCTIMPNRIVNVSSQKNNAPVAALSLILVPENVWCFSVRPQVESLTVTKENKVLQRLVLGYQSQVPCINRVIDFSQARELIYYLSINGYMFNSKRIALYAFQYVLRASLY